MPVGLAARYPRKSLSNCLFGWGVFDCPCRRGGRAFLGPGSFGLVWGWFGGQGRRSQALGGGDGGARARWCRCAAVVGRRPGDAGYVQDPVAEGVDLAAG